MHVSLGDVHFEVHVIRLTLVFLNSVLQMELNDELFRLTDVATEAIYPDAMIADCYVYLFNLANKVVFWLS